MTTYDPELTDDPRQNAATLQRLVDEAAPGDIRLPAGRHLVAGGLVLTEGWALQGPPGRLPSATLVQVDPTSRPFVHLLGSRTSLCDLRLEVPAAHPGPHDGDSCTAVTVGRYLYPTTPPWLEDVTVRRLHVLRTGRCPANSIAVMGAVRDLALADVHVHGGGTGLAVHWGAPGVSVGELTGETLHPHRLRICDLHVRDAFEGFYLSSVHDVRVERARMADVEIGFRLLPGDNTDRFHETAGASPVSSRITVRDCVIDWTGSQYALRVAGWGRSEVDRTVSQLDYRELTIADVAVHPRPVADEGPEPDRAAIVVENAGNVAFQRLSLADACGVVPVRLDGRELPLSALTAADAVS